jgi:photosystem II stability/assembly factor-like uncharacterized protein
MNKNFLYFLIIFGIIFFLINGCKKENIEPPTNIDSLIIDSANIHLLTNDSSKIWYLSKIVTLDSTIISPSSCIVDDEFKFQINGECLIDNMGTVYHNSSTLNNPLFCSDTVDIIDHASWILNMEMDTLTISAAKYSLTGKILKLTSDSLILNRIYRNSIIQKEFYVTKKGTPIVDPIDTIVNPIDTTVVQFDISEGQSNWTKISIFNNIYKKVNFETKDIFFINPQIGFISGSRLGQSDPEGIIFRTQDGGATWEQTHSYYQSGSVTIFFTHQSRGYATFFAASEKNYESTDNGDTWTLSERRIANYPKACLFGEQNVVVGSNKTTNGGQSWQHINLPLKTTSYSFYNLNFGVCATSEGLISKTNNFGISWDTIYYNNSSSFSCIVLTDSITIIAGGNKILKSCDKGATWSAVSVVSDVTDIKFVNKNIGFASTDTWNYPNKNHVGSILKTTDGGETWQINYQSAFIGFQAMCILNEQTIISAGAQGLYDQHIDPYIIKTTTQGE